MKKNRKLAEMQRRKEELETKVRALREGKNFRQSLSYLIESELEKAEIVLAAKAIIEKIGKMAEDLAKVNGDDLIPMMDSLKAAFGPQMADNFQKTVADKLTAATTMLTQTKDAVSSEVAKLEGVVNGDSSGNDMSADPMAGAGDLGGDAAAMGGDDVLGGDAAMGDMGGDMDAPLGGDEAGEEDLLGGGDLGDDPFDDDAGNAAGRARKESAAPKKGKKLAEGPTGAAIGGAVGGAAGRVVGAVGGPVGSMVGGVAGRVAGAAVGSAIGDAASALTGGDDEVEECEKKPVTETLDAKIIKSFKKSIREGATPVKAAKAVAERFGVDFADVVEVVRESRKGK